MSYQSKSRMVNGGIITANNPKRAPIPDALKNFDQLPDSANVRLPVVQGLYSCSAATVWRRVQNETIPAPQKHSERITTWNVGQLRQSLARGK